MRQTFAVKLRAQRANLWSLGNIRRINEPLVQIYSSIWKLTWLKIVHILYTKHTRILTRKQNALTLHVCPHASVCMPTNTVTYACTHMFTRTRTRTKINTSIHTHTLAQTHSSLLNAEKSRAPFYFELGVSKIKVSPSWVPLFLESWRFGGTGNYRPITHVEGVESTSKTFCSFLSFLSVLRTNVPGKESLSTKNLGIPVMSRL